MRAAYYFGCRREKGHHLWPARGPDIFDPGLLVPKCPWSIGQMDTALLKNRKVPDVYDGAVYRTCGHPEWNAFIWWDRSLDTRPGSNSGFYVQGFDFQHFEAAFRFAQEKFPDVIERQQYPLRIQP